MWKVLRGYFEDLLPPTDALWFGRWPVAWLSNYSLSTSKWWVEEFWLYEDLAIDIEDAEFPCESSYWESTYLEKGVTFNFGSFPAKVFYGEMGPGVVALLMWAEIC